MPCYIHFSLTLQTEILSTETLDFVKQIVILKSFNSVLEFLYSAPLFYARHKFRTMNA